MRNKKGSVLLWVMMGGVMLGASLYSITRSFASAYSFNRYNRSITLARGYVVELAEYLKAKPPSEILASMGNYPAGAAVNDANGLMTPTCKSTSTSAPTPTPSPQPFLDPIAALPKMVLGGPSSSERGYIVNITDLAQNQIVPLPCGTNIASAYQMLETSSTLQLSFTVFVAWKNASGAWQRETADVIGSAGSTFMVSSNPVARAAGTIQGSIVDQNLQTTSAVNASITLDGGNPVSANPYTFANISAENHIVTVPNYSGYNTLYSVCVNCTNHPSGSYILGNQVTVTVPANGYVDLSWQYSAFQVTANLLANGTQSVNIADNASALLTWTSTNAASCSLSRSDGGACGSPTSGCSGLSSAGLSTGALIGPITLTYTLVCRSAYTTQTASSSVTVTAAGPTIFRETVRGLLAAVMDAYVASRGGNGWQPQQVFRGHDFTAGTQTLYINRGRGNTMWRVGSGVGVSSCDPTQASPDIGGRWFTHAWFIYFKDATGQVIGNFSRHYQDPTYSYVAYISGVPVPSGARTAWIGLFDNAQNGDFTCYSDNEGINDPWSQGQGSYSTNGCTFRLEIDQVP